MHIFKKKTGNLETPRTPTINDKKLNTPLKMGK